MNEIAHWTPSFSAVRFHGTMPERERLKLMCKENEYDIYVTSYEQFVAERNWFARRVWKYVVVDEGYVKFVTGLIVGHCLKNDQTQLAHAVGTLNAEYRLLLTGTPLQKYFSPLFKRSDIVPYMSCGHCFIFCIRMYLRYKLQMRLKMRSILPREHMIQNSLKQLVRYLQKSCYDE